MFWYEDDVRNLESKPVKDAPYTLFYGSSSIRMWTNLERDLSVLNPINLGFGGSTLAACAWFFDRVMARFEPRQLVIYAGDNDLGDGRHPEEIFLFFQQLAARANKRFGNLPCYFISLKPSPSRWQMADQFKFANKLISEEINNNLPNWRFIDIFNPMLSENGQPGPQYFLADGLHLSEEGYLLWKNVIQSTVSV